MFLRADKDLRFCDYDSLSFWSPPGVETEVDFIIARGKERIAIETKSTKEPNASHLKGLRALANLAGLSRRILV